jgi:hypothetical protein
MSNTMTPAEVLALMDRIASFNHPIDRIEVMSARAAVANLISELDVVLFSRNALKRECEALRDALQTMYDMRPDCSCEIGNETLQAFDKAGAALSGAGHD